MDRTIRWETEAIRSSGASRQSPPKPTRKRAHESFTDNRNWVTLREAEEATGIPVNTLRKWIRRADLPSYLEADGDIALRMVDLDAVVARAKDLGRQIREQRTENGERKSDSGSESEAEPSVPTSDSEPQANVPTSGSEAATMIVPVDAWNKMLNQLGNLHEAGQQLAEARERAAKAETESRFLRQQLSESREQRAEIRERKSDSESESEAEPSVLDSDSEPQANVPTSVGGEAVTTTYWRYLTTGWRDRKKRR